MFIVYSVLDGSGRPLCHYRVSGDHARTIISSFERLSDQPIKAMTYHAKAGCWISEFSRDRTLTNDKGETNFLQADVA